MNSKRFWITNYKNEKLVYSEDAIPEGWIKGRIPTGKTWNNGLNKYNNALIAAMAKAKEGKSPWIKYTKEYIQENFPYDKFYEDVYELGKVKTCKKLHISEEVFDKCCDIYSINIHSEEFKNHRYNKIYTEEFRKRRSEQSKGLNNWSKGRKRNEIATAKWLETMSNKSDSEKRLWKLKEYETRKKNNTLGNHKTEDEIILQNFLKRVFGEEDITYQYFDENRYPFKCDFYIKSEDLFIELHAGWEHCGHPYNYNSKEDQKLLEELKVKSQNSSYYDNVIYQWTDLDVRKLNCFKENNLNYIIGYTLEEIYEKIKNKKYLCD